MASSGNCEKLGGAAGQGPSFDKLGVGEGSTVEEGGRKNWIKEGDETRSPRKDGFHQESRGSLMKTSTDARTPVRKMVRTDLPEKRGASSRVVWC